MPTKTSTKPTFFAVSELFSLTWQTWQQLLPKYLKFLSPLFLLSIVELFLIWKFPPAKGDTSAAFTHLGLELLYASFFGTFQTIVYILIFKNRQKKLVFSQLYQEAKQLFWGFWLESSCFFLLACGGFWLLYIPTIIYTIWFGFFGWLRIYTQDQKQLHLGESRALVKGYTKYIFGWVHLPIYVLMIGMVATSLWVGPHFGFALNSWQTLVKSLVVFCVSLLSGSFFFTMQGLVFERLLAMKAPVQPQRIVGQVIISVIGWLMIFAFVGLGILAVILSKTMPKPTMKAVTAETASASATLAPVVPTLEVKRLPVRGK